MAEDKRPARVDPWHVLRKHTAARIGLGRTGGSQRTDSLLDFRLDHARARDAVRKDFDADRVVRDLGPGTRRLTTAAPDRLTYLLRPDLGRRLAPESRRELEAYRDGAGKRDLAILVSDGLSALAAERHAAPVVAALQPLLEGWLIHPVFVAPFARVKLQDEVGELLGARHTLILLGERPGLGAPDSLGAYFTYLPRADRTDADRNCVSNIRPEGLPPDEAAAVLAGLLAASARQGVSGVALKI